MSTNGGDDDIEDEIRELTEEISDLTNLLREAFTQQQREMEEDEEEEGDLWNVGQTSLSVGSVEEYKRLRARAAKDEEMAAPYFSGKAFDSDEERIQARVELYQEGFDSLQSVMGALGDAAFAEFVREYAKEYFEANSPGGARLTKRMIDILEPSPSFFGITVVDGELTIIQPQSPLAFIKEAGAHWNYIGAPNPRLGIDEPGTEKLIPGEMNVGEFNEELAEAIFDIRPKQLPREAVGLLPLEDQQYYN